MIISRYDYVVHISRILHQRKMNQLVTQPFESMNQCHIRLPSTARDDKRIIGPIMYTQSMLLFVHQNPDTGSCGPNVLRINVKHNEY